MENEQIRKANEQAVEKWIHPPTFSKSMGLVDRLKYLHETKRYFIITELKKLLAETGRESLRILDFGSGHGGITIDVKTYLGDRVSVSGYDVSPKATDIAMKSAARIAVRVDFITDEAYDLKNAVTGPFDAVISCDVFGHVPSIPDTFRDVYSILSPGGKLIAFCETITGESLTVPRYLSQVGFRMDDSEEEHISLHSVFEIKKFLILAGFADVEIFPYEPIRFPFYPKRYLGKLWKCNRSLFGLAAVLALFQNRISEIAYNQFNLFLSKRISLRDTAGCLILATRS